MNYLSALPSNLPEPVDDGACDQLAGLQMPRIALPSTAGRMVDVGALGSGRTVIYCYPMTGVPGRPLPAGWEVIPGARGCTPQACAFRDHYQELAELDVGVFGLSTQTSDYQREMAERLHLPFEVLSDADHRLIAALDLPTFEIEDMVLIKRLTLIVTDGMIEHVFYPVFPPNESASQVVRWLENRRP